jgi:hypothetical protein
MQPIIVSSAGWSFYRRENGEGVMKLADEDIPFLQVDAPQDAQDSQDFQDYQDSNRQTENNNGSSLTVSRQLLSLPLDQYVDVVLQFCAELRESEPEEIWRSPLFHFARFCKAHPSIIDLLDDEAMREVEKAMCDNQRLPRGCDPWEYFFPENQHGEKVSGEDARLDFMSSWVSVRHIPFRDALQEALRLAQTRPLQPARKRIKLYERFISLAGWLQWLRDERGIYLPTRTIAELLSCDQRTVSRLRRLAIQDGLLRVVKKHTFRSAGKSEATEFRFAVERFQELKDEQ